MNYEEIKDTALAYSDREDAEVIDRIDKFIRIVESRLNRMLESIIAQEKPWLVEFINETIEAYELPVDFNGFRDVSVSTHADTGKTLEYYTPKQYIDAKTKGKAVNIYCVSNGNLIIYPGLQEHEILDTSYIAKLAPLSIADPNNFISDNHPDCYIFGILAEINAFVKDSAMATMWDNRFKEAVQEVEDREKHNKWSGTPLITRLT